MGIATVVAVLATGIVNTWILVGSLTRLIATGYGQLLILKMALFAVMLSFAAANRFWLTPRLGLAVRRDASAMRFAGWRATARSRSRWRWSFSQLSGFWVRCIPRSTVCKS